jgi:hypothetical protein
MQHLSFLVTLLVTNILFLVFGYLLGFLYHYINGYVVGILSGGLFFAWAILLVYIWDYTYQPTLGKMCPNIWTFAAVLLLGYFIPIGLSHAAYYQIGALNSDIQVLSSDNIGQTDETDKYFFFRASNLRPNLNAMQGSVVRHKRNYYYTYLMPLQDDKNKIVAWLPIFYQSTGPEQESINAIYAKAERIAAIITADQFFVNIDNSNNDEMRLGFFEWSQMPYVAQKTWLKQDIAFPNDTKRFLVPIASPEAYCGNLHSIIWIRLFPFVNGIFILVWLIETAINSYRGVYAAA